MEKIALLLLEKEVITRYVPAISGTIPYANIFIIREDMVQKLGKRPFDAADDMDKYLDDEVSRTPFSSSQYCRLLLIMHSGQA